jgi:hypothetical protein
MESTPMEPTGVKSTAVETAAVKSTTVEAAAVETPSAAVPSTPVRCVGETWLAENSRAQQRSCNADHTPPFAGSGSAIA